MEYLMLLQQGLNPSILKTLGEILANPWWAAVLCGILIILHFMRDAAVDKRFSGLLEEKNETTKEAAQADLEQALALKELAERVDQLERTVYRKMETVVEEVITNGEDSN